MKTTIIALCAAPLIAAAPAVLALDAPGKAPALQHKVAKKHRPGVSGYVPLREVRTKGSKSGYPKAFRYAPAERIDSVIESSRQAGGGGGGGGM